MTTTTIEFSYNHDEGVKYGANAEFSFSFSNPAFDVFNWRTFVRLPSDLHSFLQSIPSPPTFHGDIYSGNNWTTRFSFENLLSFDGGFTDGWSSASANQAMRDVTNTSVTLQANGIDSALEQVQQQLGWQRPCIGLFSVDAVLPSGFSTGSWAVVGDGRLMIVGNNGSWSEFGKLSEEIPSNVTLPELPGVVAARTLGHLGDAAAYASRTNGIVVDPIQSVIANADARERRKREKPKQKPVETEDKEITRMISLEDDE